MFKQNQIIHEILATYPHLRLPLTQEMVDIPSIVVVVDPSEQYYGHPRIVYVGHSTNLSKRWRQLFYNQAQSHIYQYVSECLHSSEETLEYIETHFQLIPIPCSSLQVAKKYAQQLTASLQNDDDFQSNESWLGNTLTHPPLKQTKLWQTFAPQSVEVQSELLVNLIEMLLEAQEEVCVEQISSLSELAREARNFQGRKQLRLRNEWIRNPYVKAYILERADGRCERCEQPAPFRLPNGKPYLEVHHVIPLEQSGPDTIENCIALCPNCHREVHYAPSDEYLI